MRALSKYSSTIAICALVSACGMFTPDLIKQGIVRTDIEESEPVQVTHATVYREDEITVVRGEAAFPPWYSFGIFSGHIDLDIVLPAGKVIQRRNVSLVRKRLPKKRGRRAFFVSRFAIDPPKGTIVRVSYHQGLHENSS